MPSTEPTHEDEDPGLWQLPLEAHRVAFLMRIMVLLLGRVWCLSWADHDASLRQIVVPLSGRLQIVVPLSGRTWCRLQAERGASLSQAVVRLSGRPWCLSRAGHGAPTALWLARAILSCCSFAPSSCMRCKVMLWKASKSTILYLGQQARARS
eukprot:scaffold49105_cov21-Tisochrysis_lutea.AAC.3